MRHLVVVQEGGRTTIFKKAGYSYLRAQRKANKLTRKPGRFICIVRIRFHAIVVRDEPIRSMEGLKRFLEGTS